MPGIEEGVLNGTYYKRANPWSPRPPRADPYLSMQPHQLLKHVLPTRHQPSGTTHLAPSQFWIFLDPLWDPLPYFLLRLKAPFIQQGSAQCHLLWDIFLHLLSPNRINHFTPSSVTIWLNLVYILFSECSKCSLGLPLLAGGFGLETSFW